MIFYIAMFLHLSSDGCRAWRVESSPCDRQEPLSHFWNDHWLSEKKASKHTRVKASQIEDDVLGVDDVEGGKQVRRVDVKQAVNQIQRLFAVVPEE